MASERTIEQFNNASLLRCKMVTAGVVAHEIELKQLPEHRTIPAEQNPEYLEAQQQHKIAQAILSANDYPLYD